MDAVATFPDLDDAEHPDLALDARLVAFATATFVLTPLILVAVVLACLVVVPAHLIRRSSRRSASTFHPGVIARAVAG